MLELFAQGFVQMANPLCIGMTAFGVFLGVMFGCVPGLNGNTALVLVLPLTYKLPRMAAFALIMGIYIGSCSGGLISAILLNIPGAASNVATQFDGSPMARRGEAGKALGTGIFYSFIGSLIGFAALFFLSGPVAGIAINFGKADYFWMAIFALTMVVSLSSQNLLKGLAVACLGLLCSFIGASEVDGQTRMTLGFHALDAGIDLIPALIGIFAVGELINASKAFKMKEEVVTNYKIKGFGFTAAEFKEQTGNMLLSGVVGAFIGILPGIGGMTANLVAYSISKSTSKHPEKYGTGYMGGVVASETANNACVGGAMIPLFALGIPGDTFTAVMLGVMMVHGLQPGPLVMTKNADFIYGIFVALMLANLFCVTLQYFGIKIFVRLLAVPKHILLPIIMVLSLVGAIAINNRVFDAWVVLVFGVLGIVMNKLKFPITPIILGFILGPLAEDNLRRALMLSRGALLPLVSNVPSMVLIAMTILSLAIAPRLLKREADAQKKLKQQSE
ncbi:MAG TPA: tripartite tricarboxylate transporter permease [Candidatus Ventricola gallistercoris]|nr:tripartite tricarboxylate transporter permease [Candidatus Ventricola gallistercoris]